MEVSVVIPCYNEEKNIEPVILSLLSQTKKPKKIIVVDGLSTDRTAKIVKKYKNIKFISKKSNIPAARNIGAKLVKTSLILFLDADTCLLPDSIEKLAKPFKKKNIVIASLPLFPMQMKFRHWIITKIGWEMIPNYFSKRQKPIFCGACIMVRKRAFEQIGGFDENRKSGEDVEFVDRIGKVGKCAFIIDSFALTDMRRFEKNGTYWIVYWVTNWLNYKLRGKTYKTYDTKKYKTMLK
jgi:GT2 family glycosyltransferase